MTFVPLLITVRTDIFSFQSLFYTTMSAHPLLNSNCTPRLPWMTCGNVSQNLDSSPVNGVGVLPSRSITVATLPLDVCKTHQESTPICNPMLSSKIFYGLWTRGWIWLVSYWGFLFRNRSYNKFLKGPLTLHVGPNFLPQCRRLYISCLFYSSF